MTQEQVSSGTKEIQIEAKREEATHLFDDIEAIGLVDKMDLDLKIDVSNPIRFMYKGQHFGLHAIKRWYDDNNVTRVVGLDAYRGDLPISFSPYIGRDLVRETRGTVVDGNGLRITDVNVLDKQLEILQFIKEALPEASYDGQPLDEVPDAISAIAEKLWKGKELGFERAKVRFYEALEPVREKSQSVKKKDKKYRSLKSAVVLDHTDWVPVLKDGVNVELQYSRYDAYSNGSWTDFEEIRVRDQGEQGNGETLFAIYDISRNRTLDLFGTHVSTANGVNKHTRLLKSMGEALQDKETATIRPN